MCFWCTCVSVVEKWSHFMLSNIFILREMLSLIKFEFYIFIATLSKLILKYFIILYLRGAKSVLMTLNNDVRWLIKLNRLCLLLSPWVIMRVTPICQVSATWTPSGGGSVRLQVFFNGNATAVHRHTVSTFLFQPQVLIDLPTVWL